MTQSTVVSSDTSSIVEVSYTLSLELSVNRASYGQLTEGGPIPIPQSKNETKLLSSGCRWAIINENLDAMVEGTLYQNGQPVCIGTEIREGVVTGGPASGMFSGRIQILPDQSLHVNSNLLSEARNGSIVELPVLNLPALLELKETGNWSIAY